jgi:hypothetical protein
VTSPLLLRAFYRAKPLIPRRIQIAARRLRARRIWSGVDRNPLPPTPSNDVGYSWPEGFKACALITHDVETTVGQRNIGPLVAIETEFDVRSCWNFPTHRYEVDTALIAELRHAGNDVGVHGVYHDGRLFDSESIFHERLATMEVTAAEWQATGFRSPSLIYDRDLLSRIPFSWDSSMPAWDPFQPKRGDCLRYVPFALNDECIELPVTLWQDFTLFDELGLSDIQVWRRQIDFVYEIGGLINVIVHPDYMVQDERLAMFRALLEYLDGKERLWQTTPTEVATWERRGDRHAPASTKAPG